MHRRSQRPCRACRRWRALIELLVPPSRARTGRPPRDRRTLLNGIFWILHTGAPWRDLPERFGPWQTVYHHFAKWRREGIFAEIIEALQITLDQRGLTVQRKVGRIRVWDRLSSRSLRETERTDRLESRSHILSRTPWSDLALYC